MEKCVDQESVMCGGGEGCEMYNDFWRKAMSLILVMKTMYKTQVI